MSSEKEAATKDLLANRVGWKCSNPNCRRVTRGVGTDKLDVINIGVVSHITAAAKGGLRYDENMSVQERKSFDNGIWLCQSCSKLIDSDVKRYTVDKLKKWEIRYCFYDRELAMWFDSTREEIGICGLHFYREPYRW